jgi:hypothetical protein
MDKVTHIQMAGLKTKKDFALAYANIGWNVFPLWWIVKSGDQYRCACSKSSCDSPGKHPHPSAKNGQLSATTDSETIQRWWTQYPNANIAVYLAPSHLVAVDIDPRNDGMTSIEQLEDQHGAVFSDLLQFTGGGGEHRIFTIPDNIALPGKLAKGIDLKQNGYIVVEPSSHISGKTYEWEASSSPLEGEFASPLPDWIRDLGSNERKQIKSALDYTHSRFVTESQITDLRSALLVLDADDRDNWQRYGHALKTIGSIGWQIWDEWSSRSDKYDYPDQLRVWRSFNPKSINIETIFHDARQANWRPSIEAKPLSSINLFSKPTTPTDQLKALPGVLGLIENYYNVTARIPQPQFAQQMAFGVLSVILGRRFKTIFDDYSSLYFLNIAPSACGKEHIKKTTEKLLTACDMDHLLVGDGYTSGSAVLSSLKETPVQMSIIDELGHYLEATNNKNNHIGRTANTTLMECIGRLDGMVRSKNYSTHTNKVDSNYAIKNPAITIQSMTTPTTFYDNLSVEMIKDGFFGRFITHHSKMPRVVPRKIRPIPVPIPFRTWVETLNARIHDPVNAFQNYSVIGDQVVLDVAEDAEQVLNDFSAEMIELMNQLEPQGLDSLVGRYGEFSGRLALIIALSNDANAQAVQIDDAKFATDYMRARALETIADVTENLTGSNYQASKKEILNAIRSTPNGVTERDMHRKAPFSRYKDKELSEIVNSLVKAGQIQLANTREGKPGKARMAFLATEDVDELAN